MEVNVHAIDSRPQSEETIREHERAPELLAQALSSVWRHTDRLFAGLLVAEWIGGIVLAVSVSPKAWEGRSSYLHPHIWAAVLLELVIISLPVGLALRRPGWVVTRHAIAVAQMLTSALLIHLTGGRIETHFHVFGSLAFLAFYRDWRVLLTATVVVALDHMLRGIYLPISVFGVVAASPWRWVEHAAWVLFTDTFLVRSCILSIREMTANAHREARLEIAAQTLDGRVQARTADLRASNDQLQQSLTDLHQAQAQLLVASRDAGKADVATTVLHNVGNVLNSVNVSAAMMRERLDRSKIQGLPRVVSLLKEHGADLGRYLSIDEKGKQLPEYLSRLTDAAVEEQGSLKGELVSLQKNIDHIKVIVSMQQRHAKSSGGVAEVLAIQDLLDDAIRLDAQSDEQHRIEVVRSYEPLPDIEVDRHKVFQVVTNLLTNARQALKDCPAGQARRMVVGTRRQGNRFTVFVEDTGSGIAEENRSRIFNFGFTTKKEGHGFGLHGAACSVAEMGGTLTSQSDGPGRGATFTLQLPLQSLRKAS